MPQSTMTYVLNHVRQSIPPEVLLLAFKPRAFNTTIEQRILSEVIDSVLLDINLIGGKRREIILRNSWLMDLNYDDSVNIVGQGVQGAFYLIPEEAREYHNISSVIGISPTVGGSVFGGGVSLNGAGSFGNTANNLLSNMLNSRTFAQSSFTPEVTLEGTNIVRFYPEIITDGVAIAVMLEYDSEFLNMEQSAIFAMRNFCLCAVQRYIGTNLLVSIDESEIVAGMEIGVIKDIVRECKEEGAKYQELLIKLKGAMTYDRRNLSRIIYHAI